MQMSFSELSRGLAEDLSTKAKHYGADGCSKLDALVMVELAGRHLYPLDAKLDAVVERRLAEQGWRSVSMVFIPYGVVVVGKKNSPEFLRTRVGNILSEWSRPDGWFDL
jgi:hypothetical protein